ncbi:MAG: alpha/beta hydrolase [bacterium]
MFIGVMAVAPSVLAAGAALAGPNSISVSGHYAYLTANTSNGLETIDISNPAVPVHASALIHDNDRVQLFSPKSVFVSGQYAYVVSYSNNLQVVDISDSSAPRIVGTLTGAPNLTSPVAVAVAGDYAYIVARNSNCLVVVNISDPVSPSYVTSRFFGPLTVPTALAVSGHYAFVTTVLLGGDAGSLQVLDISNPAAPAQLNLLNDGMNGAILSNPTSVAVSGNYAYVTSTSGHQGLEIVDISDPADPIHKGKIMNGDDGARILSPKGVAISGHYAFIASASSSAFEVVDVSDPTRPVHAGALLDGEGGAALSSPDGIVVVGQYAYLSVDGSQALEIVDISDPVHPKHTGKLLNGEISETPPPPPGCTVDCFSSVLFLPGLEASRLYDKRSDGSEDQLWEPNANSDVEDLYLNPDGTSINPGIYTRDIIDAGQGLVNVYKSFIQDMDQLVSEQIIHEWQPFAYDWRQSPDDVVVTPQKNANGETKSLIDILRSLAESSKSKKVTIVTHSNGGLVAKALLKKLQDDKAAGTSDLIDKVDVLIMVAAPQIGTASAVPAIVHGYDQKIVSGLLMDDAHARELGRNMPGAYGLLPSAEYLNHVNASPVTFVDNAIPSNVTTKLVQAFGSALDSYAEYKNFLFGAEGRTNPPAIQTDLPISLSQNLFAKAENLHQSIDIWTPPASLRVIELAGWGVDTVASFEYYPICNAITNTCILDERPRFTIDGDKTVVVPSAQYMDGEKYWVNLPLNNKGLRKNRDHSSILEVDSILDFISKTIQDLDTDSPYITTTVPQYSGDLLRVSVHSPVSLDAYDADGNHTGKICPSGPDSCYVEENIPNSSYLEFGEGKYLNVPEDSVQSIKLHGTGIGTFTYISQKVTPDGTSTTASFTGIPVTTATQAEVMINGTSTPTIKLDTNGDGHIDKTISPDGAATPGGPEGPGESDGSNPSHEPTLSELVTLLKNKIKALDISNKLKQNLLKKVDSLVKKIDDKKHKNEKSWNRFRDKFNKFGSKSKLSAANLNDIIDLLDAIDVQSDELNIDQHLLDAIRAKINALSVKKNQRDDLLKRLEGFERKHNLTRKFWDLESKIFAKGGKGKVPDSDAQAISDIIDQISSMI